MLHVVHRTPACKEQKLNKKKTFFYIYLILCFYTPILYIVSSSRTANFSYSTSMHTGNTEKQLFWKKCHLFSFFI